MDLEVLELIARDDPVVDRNRDPPLDRHTDSFKRRTEGARLAHCMGFTVYRDIHRNPDYFGGVRAIARA
ncbi:MAG: hypothetical protein RL417_31 [Pseudomonadota bacterium]